MTKERIYLIILVLAVTVLSGCTTPTPVVTPTATPVPPTTAPTVNPATPTPTAISTATATPVPPSTASVSISGFAFQPGTVTIARGGTVTWTNNDGSTHTVKFQDSESPALQNGKTYSKTFAAEGTYDYTCGIHTYMKGKVIVV